MLDSLREVFRFLFRPAIWFVAWAVAQEKVLANRKLLKRLDAVDPSTVRLFGKVRISSPAKCKVGRCVGIHDAEWDARGGITIGDYVHFGERVTILTSSHNYEGEKIPYDKTRVSKPVVIESFVWVGSDVVIAPGTHIEEGCVIAMGATVSGRIPKGSVVGAAKWRVLNMRDMAKYEDLKAAGEFH